MSPARQQLLNRFRASAVERLRRMALVMLELRNGQAGEEAFEQVARELHTIKGEARLLGLRTVSAVMHHVEELLKVITGSSQQHSGLTLLHQTLDSVAQVLYGAPIDDSVHAQALATEITQLTQAQLGPPAATEGEADAPPPAPSSVALPHPPEVSGPHTLSPPSAPAAAPPRAAESLPGGGPTRFEPSAARAPIPSVVSSGEALPASSGGRQVAAPAARPPGPPPAAAAPPRTAATSLIPSAAAPNSPAGPSGPGGAVPADGSGVSLPAAPHPAATSLGPPPGSGMSLPELGRSAAVSLGRTSSGTSLPNAPGRLSGAPGRSLPARGGDGGSDRWVHVSAQRVDALCDVVSEFEANFRALFTLMRSTLTGEALTASTLRTLHEDVERCQVQLDSVASEVWALRLVPIEPVLSELGRHAQELAQGLNKKLRVVVQSGGAQIERGVLDALWEPLLHLVRNSMDHGVERPTERRGKQAEATLSLHAEASGATVTLTVSDDGRGIALESVKSAAVARGLITAATAELLDRAQIYDLLFLHGFSTRTEVSDLSGRGIGLDVVRRGLDAVGGVVQLESEPNRGTQVTLTVPVRLSKERALVFGYDGTLFAISARHVLELLRLNEQVTRPVVGGTALATRHGFVPLHSMAHTLGFPQGRMRYNEPLALLLTAGGRNWAFALGGVVGEFDLIRKPCDPLVGRVAQLSSSAVLDDGRLVLQLLPSDLTRRAGARPAAAAQAERRQSRVLVVDDSAVIRDLVTQILQSGGLQVTTADNGAEALALLENELPDAVLTDVDMPELDGFGLLTRVRARWPQLPVVLFTNHDTTDYKTRAVALGASAYVVKSNFDDTLLLETLQQFMEAA